MQGVTPHGGPRAPELLRLPRCPLHHRYAPTNPKIGPQAPKIRLTKEALKGAWITIADECLSAQNQSCSPFSPGTSLRCRGRWITAGLFWEMTVSEWARRRRSPSLHYDANQSFDLAVCTRSYIGPDVTRTFTTRGSLDRAKKFPAWLRFAFMNKA